MALEGSVRKKDRRLLIVDDQEDIAALLGALLSERGYEVAIARHGREALALAAQFGPDAVMLDVMMPEMDGWKVLAALRRRSGTAPLPVIMMSAAVDPRHPGLARERGAAYLEKPFRLAQAVSALDAVLPAEHSDAVA